VAARDIVLIGVLIFVIGLVSFIAHFVWDTTTTNLEGMSVVNETRAPEMFERHDRPVGRFDYLIFGFFVSLLFALIILSWFVGGHPIFMFIFFLVIVVGVVLATILSNVWDGVTSMSFFGVVVVGSDFPLTNHLLLYLPYYVGVVGFFGLLVMFSKPYLSGGGV